jgi:hypothetical protein
VPLEADAELSEISHPEAISVEKTIKALLAIQERIVEETKEETVMDYTR